MQRFKQSLNLALRLSRKGASFTCTASRPNSSYLFLTFKYDLICNIDYL